MDEPFVGSTLSSTYCVCLTYTLYHDLCYRRSPCYQLPQLQRKLSSTTRWPSGKLPRKFYQGLPCKAVVFTGDKQFTERYSQLTTGAFLDIISSQYLQLSSNMFQFHNFFLCHDNYHIQKHEQLFKLVNSLIMRIDNSSNSTFYRMSVH